MPAVRLRADCEEGAPALPPSVSLCLLQFLTLKTGTPSLLAGLQTLLSLKKLRLPPDSQSLIFSTYHTLFVSPPNSFVLEGCPHLFWLHGDLRRVAGKVGPMLPES